MKNTLLRAALLLALAACGPSALPSGDFELSAPALSLEALTTTGTRRDFSLRNTGGVTLNYHGQVLEGAGWLRLDGASGQVEAGQSRTLSIEAVCPAEPGNLRGRVALEAAGIRRELDVSLRCTLPESEPDATPDPLNFPEVTAAEPASPVISAERTVSGINVPVTVRVSGGEYAVDDEAFTDAVGSVRAGQRIRVRLTASSTPGARTGMVLDVGGVRNAFSVTTRDRPPADPDASPDPMRFGTREGVLPGSTVISEAATVQGINVPVRVSVQGGEFSVDGEAFRTDPTQVRQGQRLRVRHVAAAGYDQTVTTRLTVGDLEVPFSSRTLAEAPDALPRAFFFSARNGVRPHVVLDSEEITVEEINLPVQASTSSGTLWINGVEHPGDATVVSGDRLRVRVTSPDFGERLEAQVTVGEYRTRWIIHTAVADVTPDPFSFPARSDAEMNTLYDSEARTLSGIDRPIPVTVEGEATLLVDGQPSDGGAVAAGQSVALRMRSSDTASTAVTATLRAGELRVPWTLTTRSTPDFRLALDRTPPELPQGGSGSYGMGTVLVERIGGLAEPVRLSVSGEQVGSAPHQFRVSISQPEATGPTQWFVAPGPEVAAGTYPIVIRGEAAGRVRTVETQLVVFDPPYDLTHSPDVLQVPQGGSADLTLRIVRKNGFSGPVTFDPIHLPGLSFRYSENPVAGDAVTLTITAAPDAERRVWWPTLASSGGGRRISEAFRFDVVAAPR
ncbi:hypothetical protein HNR42_000965 [Deinobacterium chartae]|uniref:PEGA domain-containing protein n=1 Tax=Deinobacterium chartae TaxID=521158 RepID=A0A841HZW8_9DEIO|nr:hypothetical protein [Deinobacterium chartae]MBB6097548.1 hypothetical protein [Deinobacterium chartae]